MSDKIILPEDVLMRFPKFQDNRILSYIYGLFITDGWASREQLSIELSEKDKDLLLNIKIIFPEASLTSRTRNTNFSTNCTCYRLSFCSMPLVKYFYSIGFSQCDKTNTAAPPNFNYSKADFWRGVIDGDGSLGLRKADQKYKQPFISLTTKSELLKEAYLIMLKEIVHQTYHPNRNTRDNIYNICVGGSRSYNLAHYLYDNPLISMPRKLEKAQLIFNHEQGERILRDV